MNFYANLAIKALCTQLEQQGKFSSRVLKPLSIRNSFLYS